MDLPTVIANLKRTILGKEMLLTTYNNPQVQPYPKVVKDAMKDYLEINIGELKRILADLEQIK
jgi:hypothetical protein